MWFSYFDFPLGASAGEDLTPCGRGQADNVLAGQKASTIRPCLHASITRLIRVAVHVYCSCTASLLKPWSKEAIDWAGIAFAVTQAGHRGEMLVLCIHESQKMKASGCITGQVRQDLHPSLQ